MATEVITHGPTNDHAGAEVDDDRQVEPTFSSRNVRDVCTPFLVGCGRREILLEQVRYNQLGMVRVGYSLVATPLLAPDAMLSHQPRHALAAAPNLQLSQGFIDARATVAPTALLVNGLNFLQ